MEAGIFNFVSQHKLRYGSGMIMLAGISILQLLVPRITGDIECGYRD
jgi:hypothetical protein